MLATMPVTMIAMMVVKGGGLTTLANSDANDIAEDNGAIPIITAASLHATSIYYSPNNHRPGPAISKTKKKKKENRGLTTTPQSVRT